MIRIITEPRIRDKATGETIMNRNSKTHKKVPETKSEYGKK